MLHAACRRESTSSTSRSTATIPMNRGAEEAITFLLVLLGIADTVAAGVL
jgi:hypothetical protein